KRADHACSTANPGGACSHAGGQPPMKRFRPLLVMGTRPEAIKMAPVVAACRDRVEAIEPLVCFTGQHEEMLRQTADYFDIQPDFDLKAMSPGQSLAQLT